MNYKNMKIEINESQPLDDVVGELERLGYELGFDSKNYAPSVECYSDGIYDLYTFKQEPDTTLTELKAMTND